MVGCEVWFVVVMNSFVEGLYQEDDDAVWMEVDGLVVMRD